MHIFNSLMLLLVSCVIGCTDDARKPLNIQDVAHIEFRPVGGTASVITNKADLALIGEWLNEAMKSPISSFTLKAHPKPVHSVAMVFKTGDSQSFLVSGGGILQSRNQPTNTGRVERLTILAVQGKQYLIKSCPVALLHPRPIK